MKYHTICTTIMLFILFTTVHSNFLLYAQEARDGILDLAEKQSSGSGDTGIASGWSASFHGHVKSGLVAKKFDSLRTRHIDQLKLDNRVGFQFEGFMDTWGHVNTTMQFSLNLDCRNPEVNDLGRLTGFRMVESYFDWYPADWLTVRAGRQFIIWGEIEGIDAPTDIITPMDYTTESTEFIDARIAPDALLCTFSWLKGQRLDLVWLPYFIPAQLPPEEIVRKGETRFATVVPRLVRPDKRLSNGGGAIRLAGAFSRCRYAAAFLYGFDSLPDSRIGYRLAGTIPNVPDLASVTVDLVYNRVMIPTLDFSVDIKDLMAVKFSGALTLTKDFAGRIDEEKNATIRYLAGVETPALFSDLYCSFYAGQLLVLNYTDEHPMRISVSGTLPLPNELPNYDMLHGFDQLYRFKWLISNTLRRAFLSGNRVELLLTYALSASPAFNDIDYTINGSLGFKFTAGFGATLGLILTDRVGVVRNYGMLELKYVF